MMTRFHKTYFAAALMAVLTVLMALTLLSAARAADDAASTMIRLNTLGYLPAAEKKASIPTTCSQFTVTRLADGSKAFEGKASGPVMNSDTGEQVFTADFSALQAPGVYQLDLPGIGKSASFKIAADVYDEPFRVVMQAMYLWRCGTAVRAEYQGNVFEHAACHMQDAWLDVVTGKHEQKESTGGWHDAGDYNKYVVNAGVTVGAMLRAWEDFGSRLEKMALNVPEKGGKFPDFLDEVKWETDWLLTMQAADGSVYHKVSTKKFGGFILPEFEKTDRFFVPWGSAATADFVAMLAMASRSFRPYDAAYADRLLDAAKKSYAFLVQNPQNHRPDQSGFSTGGYGTSDPDDRLWAAAELWETTGDPSALKDLETRIKEMQARLDPRFDWGNVANLGFFTYMDSKHPGRDAALVEQLRKNILLTADQIVTTRGNHGYGRPMGTSYSWGCNGTVARQVMILMAANRLAPKREYTATALDALNHLFGRNYYGRSFVTGLGYLPPLHPHDRRSGGDNVVAPWPGYVIGGSNPGATAWRDDQNDFRTNEIAINWQGALIYAVAAFIQ